MRRQLCRIIGFFGTRSLAAFVFTECGACKYGTGLYKVKSTEWPQVDYDWEPANTYAEACEIVAALKLLKPALNKSAKTDCDLCHPGRHK
jgi:hypothetical protein